MRINLPKGFFCLIDREDLEKIMGYKWYAHKDGNTHYAVAHFKKANGERGLRRMHRIILGAKKSQMCDHINHNGLDNRKTNLRFCTNSQNQHNTPKRRGKSKYKGVHFSNNRFYATIRNKKKYIYIGCFKTEKEAVIAYNEAAKKYHKEFAVLNKI